MKKSFVFYASWWKAIEDFPRDVQGDVLTAIVEYGLYGETTKQLRKIASTVLNLVKPQIDANNSRYESGKLGGAPVGNTNNRYCKKNGSTTEVQPKYNRSTTEVQPNVYVECSMYNEDENDIIPPISPPLREDERERINYQSICDYYNKTCTNMPRCTVMTEKRKCAVKARVNDTSIHDVYKVIDKAAESPFLCGHNDRNWVANFDWIFRPTNFLKILEGNYDGKHEENRRDDMQRRIIEQLNEEAKRRREELGCN